MKPLIPPKKKKTVKPLDAWTALYRSLAGKIAATTPDAPEGIVRIEVEAPSVIVLGWLAAQPAGGRIYWASREEPFEAAGVGEACVFETGPAEALSHMAHTSARGARCYGALRFAHTVPNPDPRWDPFGASRFILPRFELTRKGTTFQLACHLAPLQGRSWKKEQAAALEALSALAAFKSGKQTQTRFPAIRERSDFPGIAGWSKRVAQALEHIAAGEMDKVVLARETQLALSDPLEPIRFLLRLTASNGAAFRFCIEPVPGTAFLGASPERLYRREGQRIISEAIAGTRPRGATIEADEDYARELRASEKDLREHAFVTDRIRQAIEPLCEDIAPDAEVSVLRLPYCQHLRWTIRGRLMRPADDAVLLGALHPTPAVGGSPTHAALDAIARIEPFDRGLYAGPIGWIGHDGAEFAVAIRSALVHNDKVSLFTGAGIVRGSVPGSEWNEIEAKMGPFLRLWNPT